MSYAFNIFLFLVPQQWICNGVQECDSGSDELGCG